MTEPDTSGLTGWIKYKMLEHAHRQHGEIVEGCPYCENWPSVAQWANYFRF